LYAEVFIANPVTKY